MCFALWGSDLRPAGSGACGVFCGHQPIVCVFIETVTRAWGLVRSQGLEAATFQALDLKTVDRSGLYKVKWREENTRLQLAPWISRRAATVQKDDRGLKL